MLTILVLLIVGYVFVHALRRPPPNEKTRWYRVPTFERQKLSSQQWMIVRVDEDETPPPDGVLVGRGARPD
jgi:hypothetical protein